MTPVYQKSGIEIYHGDALHVLPELKARGYVFDALITDPPYSSGGQFRGDRAGQSTRDKYALTNTIKEYSEFAGDNRDQRSFAFWCSLWLSQALEILKPAAPVALFTDWRQLPSLTDALQSGGFVWRGIGVWDKTEGARPAKGRFRNQCEYVVWGSNGPMPDQEGPCLPGVWRAAVNAGEKFHQTGKPLSVMREICRIAWRPKSKILDPFIGSGTTLLAARDLGLKAVGIEIVSGQVETTIRRLAQKNLDFAEAT